jgi:hypothetical protein
MTPIAPHHPSAWYRVTGLQKASMFASGFWLIALVATSLAAAALTLYAAQLQVRTASLTINGQALSIWRATEKFEAREGAYLAAEIAARGQRGTLAVLAADVERQATVLQRTTAKATAATSTLETAKADLVAAVKAADAAFAREVADKDGDDLSTAVKGWAGLATAAPAQAALGAYATARERLAHWQAAARAAEANLARPLAQARKQAMELKAVEAAPAPPKPALSADAAMRSQATVDTLLYEIGSLGNSWLGRTIRGVALLPSDFLVLMLVSAMGLLGSSLQIIYLYFTEFERRPLNFYLIRPCFGIITAFVVYIVAKAGIPLIADPARLGGDAPVNPWFIAFLAIISGLLSERAIATLLAVGTTYFRGTEAAEPARWARSDLRPAFKVAGHDPQLVRQAVRAEADEWDGWLQGRSPVPSQVQTMVSVVLQQPKRDLFSDLPPAVSPAEPSAEPAAATPADRIRDYYRADAASKAQVQKWFQDKGISEPIAIFLRSADRAADRASLAHDLKIQS